MATLLTVKSGTQSSATKVLGTFSVQTLTNVQVGINVTAKSGTSPSLQPYLEMWGSDDVWYSVWKPTAITATGQTVAVIGPAATNQAVMSGTARLRITISGSATPKFTLSADVHGC